MSHHKTPLTDLERKGLRKYGYAIGYASQLSDAFREGIAWALSQQTTNSPQADGMANSRDMFEQFATLHNMPVLKVGEAYSNDDTNYAWWVWQKALSTTAQVDGRMVNADALIKAFENDIAKYDNIPNLHSAIAIVKAMLSAYKPQADANTPPDVYDIVVDTGDGIYHTAEVVHFQQSGSKRMIQVRLGEPQADDVRKDAWISVEDKPMPTDRPFLSYRNGNVRSCYFYVDMFDKVVLGGVGWCFPDNDMPTHWQPLPAPPLDKAKE